MVKAAAGQEVDVGAGTEGDGADAVDHQLTCGLDLLHEGLAHDGGNGLGLVARHPMTAARSVACPRPVAPSEP